MKNKKTTIYRNIYQTLRGNPPKLNRDIKISNSDIYSIDLSGH
jgi:hypothetical protein